jgi:lipid-A-disaccharide synthase
MKSDLHIFMTAGEASGDILGARLIKAIKEQFPGRLRFSGVGGTAMQGEGLNSLFPMTDLSVMGVVEVLPRLPLILRRIRQTAEAVRELRPDIVVTIDSPDFSFRVAKRLENVKKVHYVAPTVWAWRPERAAKLARLYGGVICLFPFEPPYFTKEGMAAVCAGHPALEAAGGGVSRARFREQSGIAQEAPLLGVLFGSRGGELKRMGPALREAVRLLARERPGLVVIAPTLPHLKKRVARLLADLPCRTHIISESGRKWAAFAAMDAALAVSGTVGLELAVAGVPHAIGYRMNALTYRIVRPKIRVKYAHLANILLDRPVVPELIQQECTPENLAAAVSPLFGDTAQKAEFEAVRRLLAGADPARAPSEQAAAFVLSQV